MILCVAAVLACLPDVDYLPGLVRGYLNTTHQQTTHSVAWVLLVSAGIWMAGRAWKPAWFGWRAAVFLGVLIGSHLAIDMITEDHFAPYGFPLWFPFSDQAVHKPFPLLPAWTKTSWADLESWRNVRVLVFELGAGGLFAAGCVTAKRCWPRRKAAL